MSKFPIIEYVPCNLGICAIMELCSALLMCINLECANDLWIAQSRCYNTYAIKIYLLADSMSAAIKNGCEKVHKSYLYNSRGHFSRSKLCKKMSTKSQRKLFDDYSLFLGGRWIEIVSKLSSTDRRKQFKISQFVQ